MTDATLTDLALRLTMSGPFAGIPVAIDRGRANQGEELYEDQLAASINEHGIAIGFRIPVPQMQYPNLPGPTEALQCLVDLWIPAGLSQEKTINQLAEELSGMFHHYQPSTMQGCLNKAGQTLPVDDEGYTKISFQFSAEVATEVQLDKVADVTIDGSGKLQCATPGAAVFYSGVTPDPRNGTAIALGSDLPEVESGARLAFRAFAWGYEPSNVLWWTAP